MFGNFDVRKVDEGFVTTAYLKITKQWQPLTQRKVWRIFQRLVRHLYSHRFIDLPRNLEDPHFDFRVVKKKVKRYPKKLVQAELASLTPRLKLYAMLGLNCGMTEVDIGSLSWEQLDQNKWRIIRKRTKTEDVEDVPEVNYKWVQLPMLQAFFQVL